MIDYQPPEYQEPINRAESSTFHPTCTPRHAKEAGAEACQRGYLTTDPEWVGRYAIEYGDINADGTLN